MSLAATVLQDIRAQYPNNFDNAEWREKHYGAKNAFQNSAANPNGIVTPELMAKAQAAFAKGNTGPVKIPVLQNGDITLSAQRSCTVVGFENTSELVTFNFITYVADVKQASLVTYDNNEVAYLADLQKKFDKVDRSIATAIDLSCATFLEAEKATQLDSAFVGAGLKYLFTGDAVNVPAADVPFFFNDAATIMFENDWDGDNFDVISSTSMRSFAAKGTNQGPANAANEAFQFPGIDFNISNRIANAGTNQATFYMAEKGTYGLLSRVDPESARSATTTNGDEFFVSSDILPRTGLSADVYYYSRCADESGYNGGTQMSNFTRNVEEKWQIGVDIALVKSFISSTNPGQDSPFLKGIFLP